MRRLLSVRVDVSPNSFDGSHSPTANHPGFQHVAVPVGFQAPTHRGAGMGAMASGSLNGDEQGKKWICWHLLQLLVKK
jgi:hypothetical protein